jgi:pSer/pThr/pTyr-binding forkhead associated (FHA) protein
MSLQLQILSGPRLGDTLQIEKYTSFGREADISFDDLKMSKVHAIFDFDPGVGWLVRDPGSKNGVVVNGHKTLQHLLTQGDLIDLGTTQFRVESVVASWKPLLNQILLDSLKSAEDLPLPLAPFRTLPILSFIQGLQTGERHVLEYGPRSVGGECDDIVIFEPLCPDVAFTIAPSSQGALFETKYPQVVKINGTLEPKKILKNLDQIFIHNTIIEVTFVKS